MTTPLFPSVIAWNLLDGGTDAQDGNSYPGPALQDYAAAVVGAAGRSVYLTLRDGDAFDTAMSAAIAACRAIASAARGRGPTIHVPPGNYVMSATNSTITLEPWMRVCITGHVRIVAAGHTVPVIWLRNDVSPQFSQGSESENNNGAVIGGPGLLYIEGNKSAGGAGVRVGNGDGTWGTAYAGSNAYFTALAAIDYFHITGMDAGVELTNNNAFCQRFMRGRLTNNVYNIRTSAAAVNVNSMEQSTFIEIFMNEADVANVQVNGGASSASLSSAHQLAFYGGSMTFSEADNIQINTAAKVRIELSQLRIENGDTVVRSTVLSPKSWVKMSNVTLCPSRRSGTAKSPFLRKLFVSAGGSAAVGGDYVVQMENVSFDITGAAAWNDTVISAASNMILADDEVTMQWGNIHATTPPGSQSDNNHMRVQPIPSRSAFLNQNSGFESGALSTGWTTAGTGTWSRDTVVFFSGTASAKIVCATQFGSITSEAVPVEAGRCYYGDSAIRVDPGSASTNIYVIPEIEWLAADGSTVLQTDTATPNVSNGNAYNRRNDGWIRHQTGTLLRVAPAGARFAKLRFHVSGGVSAGANVNATVNFDQAGLIRLS